MEFTKQEQILSKFYGRIYHQWYFRKCNIIGWIGIVLFAIGFFQLLPTQKEFHKILSSGGLILMLFEFLGRLITIIGKLHNRVEDLEKQLNGV